MTQGVQMARLDSRPVVTPVRLAALLALLALLGLAAGLSAGSEGWSLAWGADAELIRAIRAPRSLGALAAGALLGLAGALAQGLFRNPLADPYLLGSAAGAGLAVVLVLAGGSVLAGSAVLAQLGWLLDTGLVLAAFCGALGGVGLTLLLAGGAARPLQLLLCGVVVGVLMGAVSDLLLMVSPEALRGRQVFLLGTTGFLGWPAVGWLVGALALVLPLALLFARALDALVLGDASASSLGLRLPVLRLLLVGLMALATGTAVSQVGLVGFVGLVAPHLVRRLVVVTHRAQLALSAAAGGVLLLAADVAARSAIAPQELPVGVLTALLGGGYLLVLLRRQGGLR
jgi:iron complex transport system permease protein